MKFSVENGYLDFNLIKNELSKAIEFDSTDLSYIVLESSLITYVGLYLNEEIKDYVCYLIFDLFFHEQYISKTKKNTLFSN